VDANAVLGPPSSTNSKDAHPDEICARTDAVLTHYDETPVRSLLLTVADRATCECLSAETCFELATP